MRKYSLLLFICCFLFGSSNAQSIFTHSNGMDHNHYSIERIENDVIMGGTQYTPGSLTQSDLHFQRLDAVGNVIWEISHDIGTAERCFDISMQGEDYILATGYVVYDGIPQAFLMRLDPSNGALVDYTVLVHDANTVRPELMGMSVIHAPAVDRYYIVGQAANWLSPHDGTFPGTFHAKKNAAGLIICLDDQLNNVWSLEVSRPATHTSSTTFQNSNLHAFSNVIDNPGIGIFISGLEGASDVARLLDYSGATIWNLRASAPEIISRHAMYFDQDSDRLLIGGHNNPTFGITEISKASISGAFLSRYIDYSDLVNSNGVWFRPEDFEMDTKTNQLWLHGMCHESGLRAWEKDKPGLISIEPGSLTAQYAIVSDVYGVKHNTMDYPYINYLGSSGNNTTVRSKKLTRTDFGLVHIGYSRGSSGAYDLNVLYTDPQGFADESCEQTYTFATTQMAIEPFTPYVTSHLVTHDIIPENTLLGLVPHTRFIGCYEPNPCGFTVNSITRLDYACYAYTHTVNITPNPGTVVYEYEWNFGDGTTVTTTSPTVNHDYGTSNVQCFYNVCVTVKAQGSDGSLCQQTYCQGFLSLNGGSSGCPSCAGKVGDIGSGQFGDAAVLDESLSVNVAGQTLQVTGFEGAYDLTIMDMNGRVIRSLQQQDAAILTLQDMTPGIFLIQVVDNAGQVTTTKAFIK